MSATGVRPGKARLLKIGEVSKRSGVGVESLRFYESRGLINPAGRTDTGYRLYDESVFERLAFVKKAQMVGFRLDEIAWIIDEARQGRRPCAEVRRIANDRLSELNRRIEELSRYRDELQETVNAWKRQGEKEGLVCGLIEGLAASDLHPPESVSGLTQRSGTRRTR